ncbi:NAD(P)/FAD-dependent oxidoreductase [Leekyejoonella antrihumi]|uniref:Ferredoxin reductase n=1 Tax=Leekyejoonella antrihumi TaxID=1660198 RepID=A0A563DV87_9MICO|nr:FAD-dependent oxidoreductase [Leekyejoonella antrihumi]TWP33614.1 ferredoxin reductase [Leekyejoonella antrihumi]
MATDRGCVVVGAGLAAANVVQTLREGGFSSPIVMVGEEIHRPYERPGLSKEYLQGSAEAGSLYVHEDGWYAEHDVQTRFGTLVKGLSTSDHEVTLAGGEALAYEHLVLATGASPRTLPIPGLDAPGVHTLRRLEDSTALKAVLTENARVVIIGAGWIGLEVAAAARKAGGRVTVLEQAQRPLQPVLGDRMADYFARLHRDQGVDLRTGVSVSEVVVSGGKATGVLVDGETVPADVVVVGVGAAPNVELARAAGLEVENGILTDEHLVTSDPAVLAVGDVAESHNTALGHRIRVEHWDNAIRQGQLAAKSILGKEDVYDWQPYFFTDQFDLGMEYVGHADASAEVVVRGDESTGEFIAFWLADGIVRAGMNVNIWDVNDDLRALIGRKVAADRLADESVALGDL